MTGHPDPITRLVAVFLSAVMALTALFPSAVWMCGACRGDHHDHCEHHEHGPACDHDHDHDHDHNDGHGHAGRLELHRDQRTDGAFAQRYALPAAPDADPDALWIMATTEGPDGCLCCWQTRSCAGHAAMAVARAPASAKEQSDDQRAKVDTDPRALARAAIEHREAHTALARATLHDPGPPCPGGSERARSLRATRLLI